MNQEAAKELLFKIADDCLIIGHRNSEWTGLGPILEEDIAFSSMAQDQIGHAQALYNILHTAFGEKDADYLGFQRTEAEFKCCHLVEYPIGEYDFSLTRNFLFNHAQMLRFSALENSSFEMLAQLAKKVKGEIKYHIMHANTWMKQLGNGTEESHARMQSAINECLPLALGIFEPSKNEQALIDDGVFVGEEAIKTRWLENITAVLEQANLKVDTDNVEAALGGRNHYHTEHLKPLIDEMTEVLRLDPSAEW